MGSTSIIGLDTITSPMVSRFTPPSSCSTHWTYEPQAANSVPGGLLMQDAQGSHPDVHCFPSGFSGWGRAPSFIQVFSPGACPVGYTQAVNNFNGETTTAVCCPRQFPYTNIVSTVNGSNKTAEFFGCTSIYPANAGVTSVFVECPSCGFRSELDGTTTKFTSVSGPITMWAQPITVAFQKSDLAMFTTTSAQATGMKTGVKTTTSHSTPTHLSTGGSSGSSTNTTLPTTSPAPTTTATGLSNGTIAGIAIGAAAVLGLLIGAAIFFQRRQKSASSSSDARDTQSSNQGPMQGHPWSQSYGSTQDPSQNMYAEAEARYDVSGQRIPNEWFKNELHHDHMLELSNHADRRYELGS